MVHFDHHHAHKWLEFVWTFLLATAKNSWRLWNWRFGHDFSLCAKPFSPKACFTMVQYKNRREGRMKSLLKIGARLFESLAAFELPIPLELGLPKKPGHDKRRADIRRPDKKGI